MRDLVMLSSLEVPVVLSESSKSGPREAYPPPQPAERSAGPNSVDDPNQHYSTNSSWLW
jgi:hypothetical protein